MGDETTGSQLSLDLGRDEGTGCATISHAGYLTGLWTEYRVGDRQAAWRKVWDRLDNSPIFVPTIGDFAKEIVDDLKGKATDVPVATSLLNTPVAKPAISETDAAVGRAIGFESRPQSASDYNNSRYVPHDD